MKKILTYLLIGAVSLGAVSCKKLDINENPNRPTTGTPTLVLPQAIVATAAISQSYNSTYYYNGGFFANVYGFGAYGPTVSLNYTSLTYDGLWINSYDNLTDYQYVIENTGGDGTLAYSNAVARIMKSFVFSKIVDNWGDVPYSEAVQGQLALTPKYDKGVDIYKALVGELNTAITTITTAQPLTTTAPIVASSDPMFSGDMNKWKQFANTLKLRLLVKMAAVPDATSFATTEFTTFDNTLGVLTDDALVNPGYLKQATRLAPIYLSLGANESDARSATSSLPSRWIYSFYDGGKLSDVGRGSVVFRNFPNTQRNQLGNENLASTVIPPEGSTAWYTGANFSTPGLGAVKGPAQGQVIMLLAEAKLLQAEAIVRGFLPGNAATVFDAGVAGSFRYLFKSQTGVVDASKNVDASLAAYKAENPSSYLVNFALATSSAQRIEAIITQKYIAMNPINCDEAFAEFRRTTYPTIVNGSSNPTATFASIQSTSTSPDRLLVRLPYAASEYQRNPNNTPQNVSIFTAKIFWDLN